MIAMKAKPTLGRVPPNSVKAEEQLLSACFLDAANIIPRALTSGITPASFYVPANQVIFERILKLQDAGQPVEVDVVGEELKKSKVLEEVGGWPYLSRVSRCIPTTASASYFIEKVGEMATLRELINRSARVVERCYNYTGPEDLARIMEDLGEIRTTCTIRSAMDMPSTPIMDLSADHISQENENLLGNGFLRRGQGGLIVGPTGIGKSSLTMQASFLWAAGESFFGIRPQRELRILIIQSENDDTDLAEMRDGILDGLKFSEADRERVKANVRTRRCFVSGPAFLAELGRELSKHPADIVMIDPLFAYAGCDLVNQAELSHFLRELLQPFLIEHRIGGILIHHTNKPQAAKPGTGPRSGDHAYSGSGHNELANWSRFVASVRNLGSRTVFELRIGKRWQRACICDSTGTPIDNVLIKHGKTGIYWQTADAYDLASTIDTTGDAKAAKGDDRLFTTFNRFAKDGRLHILELVKKLGESRRNIERRFQGGTHVRSGDDILVLREGYVVAIEAEEWAQTLRQTAF